MFAKLFETQEYGQILVKIDTDANGLPEIRFYCEPEGLGVCSIGIGYEDNDEGWDNAEDAFENTVDEEFAKKCAEAILMTTNK